MQNKKGFTLIEILLVITIISIMATAALTTYVGSTKTFGFLGEYQGIIATMRNARAYAVTNKEVSGAAVAHFGVSIEKEKIFIFADTGLNDFAFDAENTQNPEYADVVLDTIDLKANNYTIDYANLPVHIFYESGSGNPVIYQNGTMVDPNQTSTLTIKLTDGSNLNRYMVIFQASGLIEGFANNPELNI